MNRWFAFRLAMIAVAMCSAPFLIDSDAFEHGDFSKPSVAFFFEMIGLVATGLVFVVFIGTIRSDAAQKWHTPSWTRNPFDFRQPLQLFDFGSYYFIAGACVALIVGLTRTPRNWFWELPMAIGVGCWIGVRLCIALFRDRFARDEVESS